MNNTLFLILAATLLLSITFVIAWRKGANFSRRGNVTKQLFTTSPNLAHALATNPHLSVEHMQQPARTDAYHYRGSQAAQTPTTSNHIPEAIRAYGSVGRPRVVMGSDYLRKGRMSHLASFRQGAEGEDAIAQQIETLLDGRWTMFRNLDLPDKAGDIDIALVGPGGIFALEVKNYTGNIEVRNGRYYKETRSGHMARMQRNPGAQAKNNARRLYHYMKEHSTDYNNYVQAVVVLAKGVPVQLVSTATVIWTQDNIERRLDELKLLINLSHNQVERIVRVLEGATPGNFGTVH